MGAGGRMKFDLMRCLAAEALGTFFLVMAVVGSGIMAEKLAGGNQAIALLCNTLPTGAVLFVIITIFVSVSASPGIAPRSACLTSTGTISLATTSKRAWAPASLSTAPTTKSNFWTLEDGWPVKLTHAIARIQAFASVVAGAHPA